MSPRRLALTLASIAATSLLASGCEAPNPMATVFSGTTSAHRQALCWSPAPDQAFVPADCLVTQDQLDGKGMAALADYVPVIDVTPASTVGISVDPVVADAGWSITLNGKPLSRQLITTTYHRFALSERDFRKGPIEMRIFAATDDGKRTRGLWVYELTLAGSASTA